MALCECGNTFNPHTQSKESVGKNGTIYCCGICAIRYGNCKHRCDTDEEETNMDFEPEEIRNMIYKLQKRDASHNELNFICKMLENLIEMKKYKYCPVCESTMLQPTNTYKCLSCDTTFLIKEINRK